SSVEPDLLETIKKVFARSSLSSDALICTGSVESRTCSRGKPSILPNVIANTSGQAGTAHAEQENVAETFFLDIFCYALQVAAVSNFVFSNAEPGQPVRFVGAGPQRRIALPQTADLSRSAPIV